MDDVRRLVLARDAVAPGLEAVRPDRPTAARDLLRAVQAPLLEGAPHGLLWTHSAEVNEALLQSILRSPVKSK